MRLNHLTVRNFGLYRGEQTIDLRPRRRGGRDRPIVLIGGHNGAGKTTLLEAVLLCLYGRLALGPRTTDVQYSTYLREHIHRSSDAPVPVSYASVALEFEYSQAGHRAVYLVQRAWETKGNNGVNEMLRVTKDGELLEEIESQFWSDFIRSLVPPGVSQLFFFDGEKIKRLADEETEAQTLGDSVKALLGLDLVERLRADLDLYSSRHIKRSVSGGAGARLAELETSEANLMSALEALRLEEADLTNAGTQLAAEIGRVEESLAQQGEGFAAQRGELRHEAEQLAKEEEQLEKLLRELCEGVLPAALCPTTAKELRRQLDEEAEDESRQAARDQVERALRLVAERLTQGEVPKTLGFDTTARQAIAAEVEKIGVEVLVAPGSATKLHGLSTRDRESIRAWLDASRAIPARTRKHAADLLRVESELSAVHERMNRAPEGEDLSPTIRELSSLQKQHSNVTLQLAMKAERRSELERDLTMVRREQEKIRRHQAGAQRAATRLRNASHARSTLDDYLRKLTETKVRQLEVQAAECFNTLCRKTSLVGAMRIDPQTFDVALLDARGDSVPKASLSAGEKQIYAIALLWGLSKVSGRPLPMIIDTPLGRLDSVHRQNLIERYLPAASHQVIVLSTDTEVDRPYYQSLQSKISHAIHLVNHEDKWTEVTEGYFWEVDDERATA